MLLPSSMVLHVKNDSALLTEGTLVVCVGRKGWLLILKRIFVLPNVDYFFHLIDLLDSLTR